MFSDGSGDKFEKLISTLPLNKALDYTGLQIDEEKDDYTSVLVLNIGATKGADCPDDHWLYIPESKSKFHRVGFYSNVDSSFLPKSSRVSKDKVSIYVERSYPNGQKPSAEDIMAYRDSVIAELRDWKFIKDAETVHPTWIDVAYTWARPNSRWKQIALEELMKVNVLQIGRYGQWRFQGIADSIKEGFAIGQKMTG